MKTKTRNRGKRNAAPPPSKTEVIVAPRANAAELVARARKVLVGGVNSPVRSFLSVSEEPLLAARAEGAYVHDVEGRRYVDYIQSFGALFGGHAHPNIVAAIQSAAPLGTSYGLTSPAEVELAELVLKHLPYADRIRFVSSGTEAVMTAIRLARGVTGRRLVLRFDGCYHGHSDSMLVRGGSGLHARPDAASAGVPQSLLHDTIVVKLGDLERVLQIVWELGRELAAILIEPVPANSGLLVQEEIFLRGLAAAARASGALLVFDEVITGFRIAAGGARERFGIVPDLVTLGKVIGGGMPVGALAGPAKTMDQLAPLGPVYQAGTLSGNPVAMAAGRASVALAVDPEERRKLDQNCERLKAGLERACAAAPFSIKPLFFGSMFWLWTGDDAFPRRPDQIDALAKRRFDRLHARLRAHGVLLAPSLYEVGFVSTAHDAQACDATIAALERALAELRDEPGLDH